MPGVKYFETADVKAFSKIGQIKSKPKVESSERSKAIFPNPNGFEKSNITAAVPSELRESGYLKISPPITIIT